METMIKYPLFDVPVDVLPVCVPSPGAVLTDVGVLFVSHCIHHLARRCVSVIMTSSGGGRVGIPEGGRERSEEY